MRTDGQRNGRTDRQTERHMTKLIIAFRKFARSVYKITVDIEA